MTKYSSPAERSTAPNFSEYVDTYKHLDTLLWQNMATLIAITAFGVAALVAVGKDLVSIFGLHPFFAASAIFISMGFLYLNTVGNMRRLKTNRESVEIVLGGWEPIGYFRHRREIAIARRIANNIPPMRGTGEPGDDEQFNVKSAAVSTEKLFSRVGWGCIMLATLTLAGGCFMIAHKSQHGSPPEITELKIRFHGLDISHEPMERREVRDRMIDDQGNGYIRTQAGPGGWQHSHLHETTREIYCVDSKWMGFVWIDPATHHMMLAKFGPGAVFSTPTGVAHNVFLPEGAIIHTIKQGNKSSIRDWNEVEYLDDAISRHLTEESFKRLEELVPAGADALVGHDSGIVPVDQN